MITLIGAYLTCSLTFHSWHDVLKIPVSIKVDNVACRVVDDRLDKVGYPGNWKTPIIVNCAKEIERLKPIDTDGIYLFFREEGDCNYELYER